MVATCSSIGPAATAAHELFEFPLVLVDEPMAEEAVRLGRRIGVAATAAHDTEADGGAAAGEGAGCRA